MSSTRRTLCVLAALAGGAAVLPSAASAQATRTWVSGVGDDVNPCSRTAPCKTWAGAISKTAAGGEIDALDPGGFGTLTIAKAITIRGTGTLASTLNSGGINGFVVNAGVNDRVLLDELSINGAGSTIGLNGVNFIAGKAVTIRNTVIQTNSSAGVRYASTTPNSRLNIIGSTIASSANGVAIQPGAAGGLATIRGSSLVDNSNGIIVNGASFAAKAVVVDSSVTDGANGLLALGSLGQIRVSRSTIAGNTTGLSSSGGAQIVSLGNNEIYDNGTDGSPTSTVAPR